MIKMPWDDATCPNVMVEITDACNINCRFCYKRKGASMKSISRVRQDIEDAKKLRELHTVTISGGEPTLHPELCQIIEIIKNYGFHVFLLTNGVLIDKEYMQRLKKAGLDSILFHVDIGQNRPDLPEYPKFDDIKARLGQLVQTASLLGVDVSISLTLYDNYDEELENYSKFFFESEDITFLFIARGADPKHIFLKLSEAREKSGVVPDGNYGKESTQKIIDFYQNNYDIEPFSYIPARAEKHLIWISYFVPIIYNKHKKKLFKIQSNLIDSWLMEIPRVISGRYMHKTKQNSAITLLRTFFNSLSTLRPVYFARFLLNLLSPCARLRHKMIVYDNGPIITKEGNLAYCEYCPTAIVRNNKLLTCCTSDYSDSCETEKYNYGN